MGSEKHDGESAPARKRKGLDTQIIVAIIGGASVVLAALIAGAVALATSGNHASGVARPVGSASATVVMPSTSVSGFSGEPEAPPTTPEAILPDPNSHGGGGVAGVAYSPTGGVLATGDVDGTTYLWDTTTNTRFRSLLNPISQGVYGVAFSPDGSLVAADNENKACSVTVWRADTGKLVVTLRDPGGTSETSGVAFSPDGAVLAAADDNGGIYLWNTKTWQLARSQPLRDPNSQTVSGIAFNPQGTLLATGDRNGGIYLWNTATWTLAAGPLIGPGSKGILGGVALNHDGSLVAAGDANGHVYVWNVRTGKLAAALAAIDGMQIGGVAFSPNGNVVAATTDNDLQDVTKDDICVWDLSVNRQAVFTDPDSAGEFRLAFSPDGNTLAVGDANANTYLWNMSWLADK